MRAETERRGVAYSEYMRGAVGLVLDTTLHLDLGVASSDSKLTSGTPGDNDPTYRTSAFSYGVSVAAQPLIESYNHSEERDFQAIFNSTFRLSFHYSAGVPLIQSLYQVRIARLLCAKHGAEVLSEAAQRQTVFSPGSAAVPAWHKQGRSMLRANERAPAIWSFYMDILSNIDELDKVQPADKMGKEELGLLKTFGSTTFIALSIPYFLLNREITYLKEGRPNKLDETQRYHSDIREHAILGKNIGNPEFNYIFSEMGIVLHAIRTMGGSMLPDFYVMTGLKDQLAELEKLWEAKRQSPFKATG